MGNSLRDILAAVLQGPANLMAAYRALVEKFGDNAEAAAEYVWDAHKAPSMARMAGKEYTWYPPSHKFEDDPVHPVSPTELWSDKPNAPRSVSLQDAAETVARGLVSEEGLRSLYTKHLSNYHELDERSKDVMADRFVEDVGSLPKQDMQGLGTPLEEPLNMQELEAFKTKFVTATSAMKSPEKIFSIFKELIFKIAFVKMYRAMHKKIGGGAASRWACDASLLHAVVSKFVAAA
jgi:hypothetical protein